MGSNPASPTISVFKTRQDWRSGSNQFVIRPQTAAALPGLQRLAVGAVGDTVVFPGGIIEALAHAAAEGFELFLRIGPFATDGPSEGLRFIRSEIGLERAPR